MDVIWSYLQFYVPVAVPVGFLTVVILGGMITIGIRKMRRLK